MYLEIGYLGKVRQAGGHAVVHSVVRVDRWGMRACLPPLTLVLLDLIIDTDLWDSSSSSY